MELMVDSQFRLHLSNPTDIKGVACGQLNISVYTQFPSQLESNTSQKLSKMSDINATLSSV